MGGDNASTAQRISNGAGKPSEELTAIVFNIIQCVYVLRREIRTADVL